MPLRIIHPEAIAVEYGAKRFSQGLPCADGGAIINVPSRRDNAAESGGRASRNPLRQSACVAVVMAPSRIAGPTDKSRLYNRRWAMPSEYANRMLLISDCLFIARQ